MGKGSDKGSDKSGRPSGKGKGNRRSPSTGGASAAASESSGTSRKSWRQKAAEKRRKEKAEEEKVGVGAVALVLPAAETASAAPVSVPPAKEESEHTKDLKERLRTTQLSLATLQGRKDLAADQLRGVLIPEAKNLQHHITMTKPAATRVQILENFISNQTKLRATTIEQAQVLKAKVDKIEAEVASAQVSLNEAKQQVEEEKQQEQQGALDNPALAQIAQLAQLLDPALASNFKEAVRQLTLIQSQQQSATKMEQEPPILITDPYLSTEPVTAKDLPAQANQSSPAVPVSGVSQPASSASSSWAPVSSGLPPLLRPMTPATADLRGRASRPRSMSPMASPNMGGRSRSALRTDKYAKMNPLGVGSGKGCG